MPAGDSRSSPGPQRPEVVRELGHLRGQVGVGQGLAHQLAQLLALLRAERGQHPLGGRLAAGQRVDQLLDVLGLLGEELAVLVHEVGELVGGVLLPGVRGQQRVQVGQHVLDPLHRLGVRGLQGLLHPGELGVQHLAPQHVLDRLVSWPAPRGSASRSRPAPGRPRRRRRAGCPAPSRPTGRRRLPGRPTSPARRPAPGRARPGSGPGCRRDRRGGGPAARSLRISRRSLSSPPRPSSPRRIRSRSASRAIAGGQHVVADLVDGLPHVVRRSQRVGAAAPRPVAEPAVSPCRLVRLVVAVDSAVDQAAP